MLDSKWSVCLGQLHKASPSQILRLAETWPNTDPTKCYIYRSNGSSPYFEPITSIHLPHNPLSIWPDSTHFLTIISLKTHINYRYIYIRTKYEYNISYTIPQFSQLWKFTIIPTLKRVDFFSWIFIIVKSTKLHLPR